ncbi:hypothetical protein BDB01DRAFT_772303 [Pilobolus umbonatus]|nr:hypothetical protein BDB01DRAFT_772303 [Pilobolus umbonatus]
MQSHVFTSIPCHKHAYKSIYLAGCSLYKSIILPSCSTLLIALYTKYLLFGVSLYKPAYFLKAFYLIYCQKDLVILQALK